MSKNAIENWEFVEKLGRAAIRGLAFSHGIGPAIWLEAICADGTQFHCRRVINRGGAPAGSLSAVLCVRGPMSR